MNGTIFWVPAPLGPWGGAKWSNILKSQLLTRYRTLTIYNEFFEQNKMAEGGIRNYPTGDTVDVSCFYSHIGPSGIHFSSVIVQTLLVHARFI